MTAPKRRGPARAREVWLHKTSRVKWCACVGEEATLVGPEDSGLILFREVLPRPGKKKGAKK
jgi:hypothetical protein